MIAIRVAAMSAACVLAAAASAQTSRFEVTVRPETPTAGFRKVNVDKATIGSAEIRLWQNTSVEPDCSPRGQTTLTLVRPPEHGKVVISDEPFFYVFPTPGPRAACNQLKVPGHRAFYTADAGFSGRDKVVLQGSQPDGYVRLITVNINVR